MFLLSGSGNKQRNHTTVRCHPPSSVLFVPLEAYETSTRERHCHQSFSVCASGYPVSYHLLSKVRLSQAVRCVWGQSAHVPLPPPFPSLYLCGQAGMFVPKIKIEDNGKPEVRERPVGHFYLTNQADIYFLSRFLRFYLCSSSYNLRIILLCLLTIGNVHLEIPLKISPWPGRRRMTRLNLLQIKHFVLLLSLPS